MVPKKIISSLVSLMVLSVFGSVSAASSNAQESIAPSIEHSKAYEASDPIAPQEIGEDKMAVSLTSSNVTDCTQSYTVDFASEIQTYTNRFTQVYVKIDDPSFKTVDEYDSVEEGQELPVFNATVFRIRNLKKNANVVVPNYLTYGSKFKMQITSIMSEGIDQATVNNLSTLLINSGITEISQGALTGIPDTATIRCMDAEAKEGWADGWTDAANVVYGYTPDESETAIINTYKTYGAGWRVGGDTDYLVGYLGEKKEGDDNLYLPLKMHYEVETADKQTESRVLDLSLSTTIAGRIYDAVGGTIGSKTLTKVVDVPLSKGETVNDDSIYFYNMYMFKRVDDVVVPDKDQGQFYVKAKKGYFRKSDLTDYVTFNPAKTSSFGGFTQFDVTVDQVPGIYEIVKNSMYEANKARILSGELVIRYSFTNLASATYEIKYMKDGVLTSVVMAIGAPISYLQLTAAKGNNVGFIIENSHIGEGFSYDSLVSAEVRGIYITLDIFNADKNAIVTSSSVSTRFGVLSLFNKEDGGVAHHNLDLALILTIVIYVIAYIGLDIALFFFLKKKYRNDEFRRVKPKEFFITSAKHFLGLGLLTMSITFILFRWGFMHTSVVAFNPLDVYVIVFTVAAAIYVGFAIKDIVVMIKNNKAKRQVERLKLNSGVADDGTN